MKENRLYLLRGGPLDGHHTQLRTSYLDGKGNKISTEKGDKIRRLGKEDMYLLRGDFYEWKVGLLK